MNKVYIKIKVYNIDTFFKMMINRNVNIISYSSDNKYVYCLIYKKDLNIIKKYYKVEVLHDYSLNSLFILLKDNILKVILFIYACFIFIVLSNVIVEININSNNDELISDLNKTLDEEGIKRLSFKKSYNEISDIKSRILDKYKDRIEWIEIENIGMTYNVKIERRIIDKKEEKKDKCDIIANSDGIISKIISDKGVILVHNNSYVRKGDKLISGDIVFNDEVKSSVCASGKVYANKWYNVSINIGSTYKEKVYTNKVRYNLMYENSNSDYVIFKNRLNSFDRDYIDLISLLGKKLVLLKDNEYVYIEKEYTDETLDLKIDELVVDKLKLSLKDDESILYKKTLKKEINNSRIIVELFVIVEKLISEVASY